MSSASPTPQPEHQDLNRRDRPEMAGNAPSSLISEAPDSQNQAPETLAANHHQAVAEDRTAVVEAPSVAGSPTWQRVQLARHPKRPHCLDYVARVLDGFDELHGDRAFGDDAALVAGFADFEGRPVALVGQQKGRDTKQKLHRNFGMPKPEGYRKALRIMQLAARYRLPIISLMDTPGAYPGMDAEERGQAEAIAVNLREMARLGTPVLTIVIGEGGSGGALAIGVGNDNSMLENATYSVISPESCAAIIYRDAKKAQLAAEALRITA
ncbi:MAG: acetyl-CoA carboxylase carboxyl transferase subunit alpha, partial [Bryobacterales bacterium]|nr:acetyl-CoA carboxylase carboxyl transferase subunit alpha [Bryobacterales bacterium]